MWLEREPPYQLKGLRKVAPRPGQSQRLQFQITRQDMNYQTATSSWVAAPDGTASASAATSV
jgi:hypothetical protein